HRSPPRRAAPHRSAAPVRRARHPSCPRARCGPPALRARSRSRPPRYAARPRGARESAAAGGRTGRRGDGRVPWPAGLRLAQLVPEQAGDAPPRADLELRGRACARPAAHRRRRALRARRGRPADAPARGVGAESVADDRRPGRFHRCDAAADRRRRNRDPAPGRQAQARAEPRAARRGRRHRRVARAWCVGAGRRDGADAPLRRQGQPHQEPGLRGEPDLHRESAWRTRAMRGVAAIAATSAAAGALAAWLFDPQSGRRRRAVARDRIRSRVKRLDEAARVAAIDLRNRTTGTIASVRSLATGDDDVDDDVLAARVRATLGRVVSHPRAVDVSANDGIVTLRGPVLEHEVASLLRAVRGVRGVKAVDDRLEPHERPGRIPALQGGRPREQRIDLLQEHWAPATRLLVGTGGTALALYALARRSTLSPILAAGAAAMLARAATNIDTQRLLGQRGRRGIDIRKTIFVAAPI